MKFNGKVYDEIFHPVDEQNTAQVQGHLRKPEPKQQEVPEDTKEVPEDTKEVPEEKQDVPDEPQELPEDPEQEENTDNV